jgi:hypothetical protein
VRGGNALDSAHRNRYFCDMPGAHYLVDVLAGVALALPSTAVPHLLVELREELVGEGKLQRLLD